MLSARTAPAAASTAAAVAARGQEGDERMAEAEARVLNGLRAAEDGWLALHAAAAAGQVRKGRLA